MQNIYYVYMYMDPRNNLPFYIGKGKNKRYLKHLHETKENTENYKKWAYIQGLRNKGLEPFVIKYIDNISEIDAYNLETVLIQIYGRKGIDENGILTNICIDNRPPSTKGRTPSIETKKKIAEAQRGEKHRLYGKQIPNETKEKMSLAARGEKNAFYGKKHSDDSRKLMSDLKQGPKNNRYGVVLDDDVKRKIRESNRGKTRSEETKNKIRKSYEITDPDGNILTIKGLMMFCETRGLDRNSLARTEKNGRTYKGYKCRLLG
jgi:group I intron endonuclease